MELFCCITVWEGVKSTVEINSLRPGLYAEPRMAVNQKTRLRVSADLRPFIADALRAARKSLGYNQTQLAEALGSSQGAVTRWERKIDSPPVSAFGMLARLVPEDQKDFWLELSGGARPRSRP